MSPHYLRSGFYISTCEVPTTIYDFDDDTDPEKRKLLQQLTYPCPGSTAVAQRAAGLMRNAGIKCTENKHRGMDHGIFFFWLWIFRSARPILNHPWVAGVWTPLYLMYPEADIPVISISVSNSMSAAEHIAAGRALAPLVAEGVLIVGSGEVSLVFLSLFFFSAE
jgi:4,5-DOPA dioxygenase extradiol